MRNVRYNVAATLDGYIAGPNGEFDWIPHDPAVDFGALFANVDTVLIGRKTFEMLRETGGQGPWPKGSRVYVFSTTLRAENHSEVTIVREGAAEIVQRLRNEDGGDIWLFGGGELFRDLIAAGQVDRVEVTVAPILLGGGIPLLPDGGGRVPMMLESTKRYPSGLVTLNYLVPSARR